MTILKMMLITVGVAFSLFGYLIYFKKQYDLINGFEEDHKAGRKTESYAKKVGMIQMISGLLLSLIGICVISTK
ncbi:DUF3784 domain-containing protein [Filifactor villosus]|uniref:DUF3784 domain-containing protein n=1 Tax=Filifactor villosus TaxID=29374 RepID=A0ABV9QPI5_9FIRM